MFLTILTLVYVFPNSVWDNNVIRSIACAYVANDFVGLLVCKLPITTRIHHIVSCIFLLFSQFVDFNENLEAQMLFYYTFFSACTFFVNTYLGLRLCFDNLFILKNICKYGYLFVIIINWSVQLYLGIGVVEFWYVLLIIMVMCDDIILLKWLWDINSKQISLK